MPYEAWSPSATAHEEKFPAKRLIEQAIALLRTQPEQREVIEDKIHDATESKDKKGVDLDLVGEAGEAFEAGRLHEAQDLLEESIGAAPYRVVEEPNEAPGSLAPSPAPDASPVLPRARARGGRAAAAGRRPGRAPRPGRHPCAQWAHRRVEGPVMDAKTTGPGGSWTASTSGSG